MSHAAEGVAATRAGTLTSQLSYEDIHCGYTFYNKNTGQIKYFCSHCKILFEQTHVFESHLSAVKDELESCIAEHHDDEEHFIVNAGRSSAENGWEQHQLLPDMQDIQQEVAQEMCLLLSADSDVPNELAEELETALISANTDAESCSSFGQCNLPHKAIATNEQWPRHAESHSHLGQITRLQESIHKDLMSPDSGYNTANSSTELCTKSGSFEFEPCKKNYVLKRNRNANAALLNKLPNNAAVESLLKTNVDTAELNSNDNNTTHVRVIALKNRVEELQKLIVEQEQQRKLAISRLEADCINRLRIQQGTPCHEEEVLAEERMNSFENELQQQIIETQAHENLLNTTLEENLLSQILQDIEQQHCRADNEIQDIVNYLSDSGDAQDTMQQELSATDEQPPAVDDSSPEPQLVGDTLITLLPASKDGPQNCEACGKRFRNLTALTVHKRVHFLETKNNIKLVHKCSNCDELFNTLNEVKQHIKAVHFPQGYECNVCHKRLYSLMSLESHLENVHLRRTYNCQACKKKI